MAFKLGDRVTWESSSNGSTTRKQGVIVLVVMPRTDPRMGELARKLGATSNYGGGMRRNHESYVVSVVRGKDGSAKPALYWPNVNKLEPT